jgi:hypothetical protein
MTTAAMSRRPLAAWLLVVAGLAYSLMHFAVSGVRRPLSVPNIGQIVEEYEVLRIHLATGQPIRIQQPRQYGPTYILAIHGVVDVCGSDERCLLRAVYAIQLVTLAGAFAFCWLSLRLWLERIGRLPEDLSTRVVYGALLAILWLNFAPMLGIVATKNVEMWELSLLSAALYAYLRGWRWASGGCVALAALTKLLPFALFFYFLLVDRRTLIYACICALAVLTVSQALYGSEMGYFYLWTVGAGAAAPSAYGNLPGLAWHENISLKGIVAKMFGHLDDPAMAPALGYPQVGYLTVATPRMRLIGNLVSYAAQFAALVWMVVVLLRDSARRWLPETRIWWEWSLVIVMMLVLAPQTGIDYQILLLPAFSFALAAFVAFPELRRDVTMLVSYGGALVLVANIVPRSAVVRISGVGWLLRLNHYTHLTTLEGYSYYGYPLLGMLLLVVTFLRMRNIVAATGLISAIRSAKDSAERGTSADRLTLG